MEKSELPWWARIQKYIDRPWYIVAVAFLAMLDLFIMIIPTDGLLVSAVLVKPKKWLGRAIWVSLGSAIGAFLLTVLVQIDSQWVLDNLVEQFVSSGTWEQTEAFVDNYGIFALSLVAISILPQQPVVIIAALAGMQPLQAFVAVLIGRLSKYLVLAWLASHAPGYLKKLPFLSRELESIPDKPPPSS